MTGGEEVARGGDGFPQTPADADDEGKIQDQNGVVNSGELQGRGLSGVETGKIRGYNVGGEKARTSGNLCAGCEMQGAAIYRVGVAPELDSAGRGWIVMRTAVATLVAIAATAVALWAEPPAFETALVKPNHTGEYPRTYPRLQNGTFTAEIASLKTLIAIAYGLIEMRITGPDWLDTEKYDITAKAPKGVPDDQIMPLLQSLLKDRFHLESHFETKEMPVYDLVVSKGGPRLTPFDTEHPPTNPQNRGQSVIPGIGTTSHIADALARAAGRPVVDKTGIGDGRFGWTLNYAAFFATGDLSNSAAPDLFAAVER
jgi:uncharacterized protein (TIGR03435 family)